MHKILIVDDEADGRQILSEFLKVEKDYEILLAEDGNQALEIFKTQPLELVFIDTKLPGLNGVEVLRQMRRLRPEVKVVMLNDMSDEETINRALTVSEEVVEGFLTRPFNPDDIDKCLTIVRAGNRHMAFRLNPNQLEALGKFATMATQLVTQALSQIVHKDTQIKLCNVNAIPLTQISKPLEEPGLLSMGVASQFSGTIGGTILLLVSWPGGLTLLDLIKKVPAGTTQTFEGINQSYFKSLGTILLRTYLKVLGTKLNLQTQVGISELVFKHRNDLIKSLTEELTTAVTTEVEYRFTLELELSIIEPPVKGWFILIPDAGSLKLILGALGSLK